jgi:imidazolonepropionase-like amidohydrolase
MGKGIVKIRNALKLVLLGVLSALGAEFAGAQQSDSQVPALVAITHITVIDGTNAAPQADQTILIRGNKISAVGKSAKVKVPAGARVIDGRGKYLIPGLWDSHVHLGLTGESSLLLFIANGVTSVRDMAGDAAELKVWRQQIAAGARIGPRIKMAGPAVESEKFLQILPKVDQMLGLRLSAEILPTRIGISTPEDARQAVGRLADMAVDFVKFRTMASPEAYLALADEAKKRGLAFVGHEPEVVDLEAASSAGQRSIEHLPFMSLEKASEAQRGTAFRAFVHNGTWIDPTLVAAVGYRGTPNDKVMAVIEDKTNQLDPRRKYLSPSLLEFWRAQMVLKQVEDPMDWPALVQQGFADLSAMHKLGVRILAGSDTGAPLVYPGFSLHEELALLVDKGGLTAREALSDSTIEPARTLGLEKEIGTVEPGKLADLVLLNRDPLQDIRNTQQITAVIADGKVFDRAALDALLEKAASSAAQERKATQSQDHGESGGSRR